MNMTAEVQREVVTQIRAALEHEPRVNFDLFPLVIGHEPDGALVLEGETQNIAAKKLALEVAASTLGVTGIVDRLRVVPARRMGDGEVCDHLRDRLLGEQAFENCTIRAGSDRRLEMIREPLPGGGAGIIEVSVENGVVTLDGRVSSLSHKSLAGALAWWVPGSCDVINEIKVAPPQEISDREVTAAVRLALEKDPMLKAGAIGVITRNRVAVLEGYVASPGEREMAEMDTWSVFGVDLVINRLEIQQ
jgi:osmotically-inducible protein OsmY